MTNPPQGKTCKLHTDMEASQAVRLGVIMACHDCQKLNALPPDYGIIKPPADVRDYIMTNPDYIETTLLPFVWCEVCGNTEYTIEKPSPDEEGRIFSDLVCNKCHLIIATFAKDKL